jgi:DnaJ-class molecular chaperone
MSKNYYLILGIASDASNEDIKTAFRRRARELHPDTSGLESGPFMELQEAYGVLGDPERRRNYDEGTGATVVCRGSRGRPVEPLARRRRRPEHFSPFGMEAPKHTVRDVSLARSFESFYPSFDEIFDRLWSNFEDVTRPKSERLESLAREVVVTPEGALCGGAVRVRIPGKVSCPACGGRGGAQGYECWRCAGSGTLAVDFPVDIGFPPGIRDSHIARVSLEEFGIGNFYLMVVFRVSDGEFKQV